MGKLPMAFRDLEAPERWTVEDRSGRHPRERNLVLGPRDIRYRRRTCAYEDVRYWSNLPDGIFYWVDRHGRLTYLHTGDGAGLSRALYARCELA